MNMKRSGILLPALAASFPGLCLCQSVALHKKGLAEFRARNYAQAVLTFEEAIRNDPSAHNSRYYLGLSYQSLQQYDRLERVPPASSCG